MRHPDPNQMDEEQWECKHCLRDNPSSTKSCIGCGKEKYARPAYREELIHKTNVEEQWECKHCSMDNPVSAKRCHSCGKPNHGRLASRDESLGKRSIEEQGNYRLIVFTGIFISNALGLKYFFVRSNISNVIFHHEI